MFKYLWFVSHGSAPSCAERFRHCASLSEHSEPYRLGRGHSPVTVLKLVSSVRHLQGKDAMLAPSPMTTMDCFKLTLGRVASHSNIPTNVLHFNCARNLFIRETILINIVMCFVDLDSHFVSEQGSDFFQGSAHRFWVNQVDHNDEDCVAYDEDDEESPRDMLDSDWRNLHQHDCNGIEGAEGNGVASCSDRRWHDFRWIRVTCSVSETEQTKP